MEVMCVYSSRRDFEKGKIYKTGEICYETIHNDSWMPNDYKNFRNAEFEPVENVSEVRCIYIGIGIILNDFELGESYYVTKNGIIYDETGMKRNIYRLVNEDMYKFMIIANYEKENRKMALEEKNMVKGTGDTMVQDMFRAITNKETGLIQFNPIVMINLTLVTFNEGDKLYTYRNPSDKRLIPGTKVRVQVGHGESDAIVYDSIKIQKKYLKSFLHITSGNRNLELKDIVGVYKTKKVEQEVLKSL